MVVEGSGRGLCGLPSQYFLGGTEKIHEKSPVIFLCFADRASQYIYLSN